MPNPIRLRIRNLIAITSCWLALTASVALAEKPPEQMVKIVFYDATPGIPAGSFAAQPKTIYQFGPYHQRVEERPNPATKIHGLIVSKNRDSWMVDLASKTGQHIVDNGDTYAVYAPVFDGRFEGFHFGSEVKSMVDAGIKPVSIRLGDRDMLQYERTMGIEQVRLMVDPKSGVPYAAGRFTNGRLTRMIRYVEYETEMSPDYRLFEKPPGVAFREVDIESATP